MEGGVHGGCDGGHGGYNGGSFANYMNYQKHPFMYKQAPPPLTSIDRFLFSRTRIDNSINRVSDFPFTSSNENRKLLAPYLHNENGDMITTDLGECLTLDEVRNYPNYDQNQESNRIIEHEKISKDCARKSKGGGGTTSKALIKGQWTDEEDRKLIGLVNKHGERKWALIAEKMTARVGKQCRERWRNHLRPDIKKDTWSEAEVRMLIAAHQKVGNKWAEIAKIIPGRTENSIKNQWNATKRKQNSTRKNKKRDAKDINSQYSLLEDYIRSKTSDHNLNSSTTTTTTTTATRPTTVNSPVVNPELLNPNTNNSDPSLEITQSYDDELNFMQTFFQTTFSNESSSHVIEPKSHTINRPNLGFSSLTSTLHDENSNMYLNNYPKDDMSSFNHLDETIAMLF